MQDEQNMDNSRALEPCSRSPLFWEEESFQWMVRFKLQTELGPLLRNPELRKLMKPTTDVIRKGQGKAVRQRAAGQRDQEEKPVSPCLDSNELRLLISFLREYELWLPELFLSL